MGLAAHSDGDVLIHAVCDALLGALALGDIGRHFPDTSAAYAGIDSRLLLRECVQRILAKGWQLGNLDVTVIAQAPKIAPHIAPCARILRRICAVTDIGSQHQGHHHRGHGLRRPPGRHRLPCGVPARAGRFRPRRLTDPSDAAIRHPFRIEPDRITCAPRPPLPAGPRLPRRCPSPCLGRGCGTGYCCARRPKTSSSRRSSASSRRARASIFTSSSKSVGSIPRTWPRRCGAPADVRPVDVGYRGPQGQKGGGAPMVLAPSGGPGDPDLSAIGTRRAERAAHGPRPPQAAARCDLAGQSLSAGRA